MNWQEAALAVAVGAVIGYSTNWIAIRMLFRPLHEKKIMGLHIPFTPGVIPRGKKRLAGSIGRVVGGMLLTEEKVVQHLLQPEVEKQMRQYLAARLRELRDREFTVGDLLGDPRGESRAREEISSMLARAAVSLLQNAETRRNLAHRAAGIAGHLLDCRVGPTMDKAGINAGALLEGALAGILQGEKFKQELQWQLACRIELFLNSSERIGDFIPEAVRVGVHRFIADQAPRIVIAFEQYLSSPETQAAMKKRIEDFFEGTAIKRLLNGMFHLFGNAPDMLVRRLAGEISLFLADEGNRAELIGRLHQLVDETLAKSVEEVTAALDESGKKEKAGEIAAWLVEKMGESGLPAVLGGTLNQMLAENRERTWRELMHLDGPEPLGRPENFLARLLEQLLKREETLRSLETLIRRETGRLWQLNLSRVLELLPDSLINDPGDTVSGFYRYLVKEQVPGLLRFIDISGMVRQRVEELDVLQVEEMLLGIMRRELVAITWLGALLGAVLGLVMVAMQYIAK